MALRLIRGFRAISEDAALALAGLPPIDLEIKALSLMRSGAFRLKSTRLRKKPEALIVKNTGEASYAEMLRKLRSDSSLSELGSHVRKIQRTQKGELLLEVEGKASWKLFERPGSGAQ